MPLVSVIVPAYNAEKTIKSTLNDILHQSYRDFELVIVDDGSSDSTHDICEEYKKRDKRVRVIHQVNGGLSNARNNGIKIAKGKYVTLVDADDRLELYYLEYLVKPLLDGKADMSCGNTDRVKEGYQPSDVVIDYSMELFDSKNAIREMLTGKKITVGPCNRMVLLEWYKEYPFLEGKKYEDLSNSYKLHLKANSVAYIDVPLYHYVMRGGSITGSKVVSMQQCFDYYNAINMCVKGVLEKYPDIISDAAVLKARDYLSLYLVICRCNEMTEKLEIIKKRVVKWMKKNWKKAFLNTKAPLGVRLRVALFRLSPALYKKAYYIGIRIKGKSIK